MIMCRYWWKGTHDESKSAVGINQPAALLFIAIAQN
jgi:hypothetical protein